MKTGIPLVQQLLLMIYLFETIGKPRAVSLNIRDKQFNRKYIPAIICHSGLNAPSRKQCTISRNIGLESENDLVFFPILVYVPSIPIIKNKTYLKHETARRHNIYTLYKHYTLYCNN